MSCGNESRLVLRKKTADAGNPRVVSGGLLDDAVVRLVHVHAAHFQIWKAFSLQPLRVCLKDTGSGLSSLIGDKSPLRNLSAS